MTAADTLITRFLLKDEFSNPLKLLVNGATAGVKSLAGLAAGPGAAGLLSFGRAASETAADMESLKAGLAAVTGGPAQAEAWFKRLSKVAELPGLNLQGAVTAFTDLAAAGVDTGTAERGLMAFGNALATVGRGGADLEGVMYGLRQLATAPKVFAEDLSIITERVPQATKILKELYGTSRSDEIADLGIPPEQVVSDLIAKLEQLPKAAGGTKTAFENIKDYGTQGLAAIGDEINKKLVPVLDKVGGFVKFMVDSGKLKELAASFLSAFDGNAIGDRFVYVLTWIAAAMKKLPTIAADMFSTLATFFTFLADHAMVFGAIIGGIFYGGTILKGVNALIKGFRELAMVIRTTGVVAIIMEAIATGGASIAKNWLGWVAGAAAGGLIGYGLTRLIGNLPDLLGGVPGLGAMGDDQRKMWTQYKDWLGKPKNNGGYEWAFGVPPTLPGPAGPGEKGKSGEFGSGSGSGAGNDGSNFSQRIIGGGSVGEAQINAVRIGQFNAGTAGVKSGPVAGAWDGLAGTKRDLMRAIDRYVDERTDELRVMGERGYFSQEWS